jgi:predicted dehydrogenase
LAHANLPGANDRIGIACIGPGRQAANLMNNYFRFTPEARLVAVADCHLRRAEQVAARRGCDAVRDYRALLERKDVDAVLVTTPDHWHALPCIHACQAGKDVYCEKPLSLTIREGRQIVAAARKYGVVFQVGTQQRSMVLNQLGARLVASGLLGKVHTVLAFEYPSPWECGLPEQRMPAGLDWDVWTGQAPMRPYHAHLYAPRRRPGWVSFRPFSGGEMTDRGAHGLDQIQWALGVDRTGPVEVVTEGEALGSFAYTRPRSRRHGNAVCLKPAVSLRYANGVVVRLGGGPCDGGIFLGEKGKLLIERNFLRCDPPDLLGDRGCARSSELDGGIAHVQNWLQCIKTRQTPAADVEVGHRSATVCHLANIARWLGRSLTWDPVNETFPGDDAASEYLARPQRKPYQLPETV